MRGDGSSILVVEGDASLVDILGEINDFSGFVGLEIGNGATITVTSQIEIDILAKIGAVFGSGTLSINGSPDLSLSEVAVIDGFTITGSNSNLSNVSIVDGTFSLEQDSMTNINTDGINLVGASTTTPGFSIDENGQLFITDTSLTGRQLVSINIEGVVVRYTVVLPKLDIAPTQADFDAITFDELDEGANFDFSDVLSTTLPNLDSAFVLTKIIASHGSVNGFSYNSGDFFGTDIITFTLTNVANGEEFDFTADLSITAVNDAPIIGGIIPTDITTTEGIRVGIDLSSLEFADIDGDDLTVTLTASGALVVQRVDGVVVSGFGSNILIFTGNVSDINTYFDIVSNILYFPPSNITGDNTATITIVANDGLVDSLTRTINIDIIAVNDAGPTISGIIPTDITVIEDTASNIDLSSLEFSDIDGDNLTVTLTASTGTFTLFLDGEPSNETNLLSISGTASEINAYLDTASNIQYIGASNIIGDDAATFTIVANDGTFDSLISTINLDIVPINAPVIGGTIPTDISIIEDIAIDIDLSSLEFTNINEGNLTVITLTASTGTFAGVDGVVGVTVFGTGTSELVLTGNINGIHTYFDTASNIEYTGASNVYGNNAATFTITASNGMLSSDSLGVSIVNLDIGRFLGGTSGDDTIVGTSAGDIIEGLAGVDTLTGGAGADRFVYTDGDIGIENIDTITDFVSGIDKIDLSGVSGLSGVPDFMTFFTSSGIRALFIDTDDSGGFSETGDIQIHFSDESNIVEGDFLF